MLIQILKRDGHAQTIHVACLHCTTEVPLNARSVQRLEGGIKVTVVCPSCQQPFDVAPEGLGLDGSLRLIKTSDGQYVATFEPSVPAGRRVPRQLDDIEALEAFLRTLGISSRHRRQVLDDLTIGTVAHVGPVRLDLAVLKDACLDA
jgi:hypothetical protein